MKLSLGPNRLRPTITARLNAEDMDVVHANDQLAAQLHAAESDTLTRVRPIEAGGSEYAFQLQAIGKRSPLHRRASLEIAVKALSAVACLEPDKDARLRQLQIGTAGLTVDNRLGLMLEVDWPQLEPTVVSEVATAVMRRISHDIGYPGQLGLSKQMADEGVYASLERESGATLQTLPIGSCSIDTSGSDYVPEEPSFMLYQHNLYNHDQQLICLAGAIAIAEADHRLA